MKNREEILEELKKVPVCCVSTYTGTQIKNRMMHFAVSSDLKFYLTSMKTDPKTQQLLLHSEISLLAYIPGTSFPEDEEIEITGHARIVKEKEEREEAVKLLMDRSPVVAQMSQYGKLDMLSFIEVVPTQIKFRAVKDILQGIAPSVFDFEKKVSLISDWEKFKRKAKAWLIETRYPFLSVTILPILLGTAIAFTKTNSFNLIYFLLALLGSIFIHIGTNVINDYFDHKSGNDDVNNEFVRPFSGGSRMIQLGLLSPLEVLVGALGFFFIGIAIGLFLTYKLGFAILLLGLIGVISGFFYTAPVLKWASKGFGEFLVGLNFGILNALGSFYVQTKTFSPEVFWASLPLGILVSAILWINEFPDYNADKASQKNTLVVRFGKEKAAMLFKYVLLSSYMFLIIGIIMGILPKLMVIGLISLPLAIQAIKYTEKFYSNSFDMAPGNGATVLCFNIVGVVSVISYLWFSMEKFYVLPILILSIIYIFWNYNTIKSQQEAYLKLKEIA